jgi:hypothetical protein
VFCARVAQLLSITRLVNPKPKGEIVKRGTFQYGDTRDCAVEIIRTDFRPGTGDYEDPKGIREDAHGSFYDIRYTSAGPRPLLAGVVGLESLGAAVAHVTLVVPNVRWD